MSDTVADWLGLLDAAYPMRHALEWDNVGLQIGDPAWLVQRVLVTLDVTSAVIDEAAQVEGTLLVAHHPVLFKPLGRLTPGTPAGRLALAAATRRIAITAVHTNLDVATDGSGTSDPTAQAIGLVDQQPLAVTVDAADICKLVTFVPPEACAALIEGLAAAGAGHIGDYTQCSFRVAGTGTFTPATSANPYSGQIGQRNEVEEFRLEMDVPRGRLSHVVAALHHLHPYEEVAYDVVPLVSGGERGLGIVGNLPSPMRLDALAEMVTDRLPAPHLRFAGDPSQPVTRVAIVGGAGDGHVPDAIAAGAEVLITGDLRHHVALDALELGLSIIDAGHHATEHAAMPGFAQRLDELRQVHQLSAPVLVSRTPTVPWR